MKKIWLILLLCVLAVSCSQTKNDSVTVKNHLSMVHIKGFPTCYTDTVWQVEDIFGEPVKTGIKYLTKYELNKLGNYTKTTSYKSDGKLDEVSTYEYTNDKTSRINVVGNDYSEIITYYRTNDVIDSVYTITKSNNEETLLREIHENIEKNVCKVHYFDIELVGNYVNLYHYDDDGKLLKTVNGQTNKTSYECFYKNDFLIEEITYVRDFIVKKEYKYDFDDRGSCIKIEKYNVENGIKTIEEITTRNIQYK